MGKKAFSGKQKKEQLQKKRAEHGGSGKGGARIDEEAFDRAMAAGGGGDATLGADKGGVRSAFQKETDREVRARKRLSFLPIGERRDNPAVPFGGWFTMPFAGDVDDAFNDIDDPFERGAARATGLAPVRVTEDGPAPGDSAPKRSVYSWRDVPVCLPLPSPNTDFSAVGAHTSRQEIDELKEQESAAFAEWTAAMEAADAAEGSGGINQYERNLEVWKQLWFTVDHSDVVMVIADARYAAVHVPLSLLRYVIVDQKRMAVIVINKSDLLPPATMDAWIAYLTTWFGDYLARCGLADGTQRFRIVQMCCTPDRFLADMDDNAAAKFGQKRRKVSNTHRKQQDMRKLAAELEELGLSSTENSDDDSDEEAAAVSRIDNFKGNSKARREDMEIARAARERAEKIVRIGRAIDDLLNACHELGAKGTRPVRSRDVTPTSTPRAGPAVPPSLAHVSPGGMLGDDLAAAAITTSNIHGPSSARTLCIGLVGNPNVGKSSLINVIKGIKTVSVSPTPGHTKHMQTVNLSQDNIILYDCPGLVFPLLGVPRPLQTILGTHQIAQTRDPASGVAYLARHLNLERMYGLKKLYGDEPSWSAHEMCEALATKRGFLNKGKGGGTPDVHRAAITILQDAYVGRLVLYFMPPPMEDISRLLDAADRTAPISVASTAGAVPASKARGRPTRRDGISSSSSESDGSSGDEEEE